MQHVVIHCAYMHKYTGTCERDAEGTTIRMKFDRRYDSLTGSRCSGKDDSEAPILTSHIHENYSSWYIHYTAVVVCALTSFADSECDYVSRIAECVCCLAQVAVFQTLSIDG